MEPVSFALGAAIGGATGKFVDKAWGLGEKWVSTYFKDHAPQAKKNAEQNSIDFMNQLAEKVKKLEQQGKQYKKVISDSLNQPDFSILLQKGIIASAQTDSKQKHELMARLIADRLTNEPESLFTLSSKQAVDVIPMLNIRQMKMLGLMADLYFLRPSPFPPPTIVKHNIILNAWYQDYLTSRLNFYQDLTFQRMDFLHLESLFCVKWEPRFSQNLEKVLAPPEDAGFKFDHNAFYATDIGKRVKELWESGINSTIPTTVGQIIGIYTSDVLTNTITSLEAWDRM